MPLPPDPPEVFAEKVNRAVMAHVEHLDPDEPRWWIDDDGLHCPVDRALCVPSSDYMIEHGRFDPE